MNLQQVSEIFFEEAVAVPASDTPPSAFGAAASVARRLVPLLEPLCRREMQRCLEPGEAVAAAFELRIEASRGVTVARLRLGGWVERISERSALFRVRAHAGDDLVLEGTLDFRVVAAEPVAAASHPRALRMPRHMIERRTAVPAGA